MLTRSDSFSQTILNGALMSILKRHLLVVVLKLPIASVKASILLQIQKRNNKIKIKIKIKNKLTRLI